MSGESDHATRHQHYGAYLKKSGECFVIKNEDKVFEVSPRKVEKGLIHKNKD